MTTQDLEQVIPQPATIEVAGLTLTIAPITVGKLPRLMRALRPVLAAWNDLADAQGGVPYLALMERAGDDVVAALAIASDQPADWIAGLTPAQAIEIAIAELEANPDFFVHLLRENPGLMAKAIAAAAPGPTPSADSSPPDTATATSSATH